MKTSLRVGIDLVDVREVQDSIEAQGDRYLRRIYTDQERRDCRDEPRRLAARFAAKEATVKALGYGDEAIGWLSIAVACGPSGEPTLELTGRAAALATRLGVRSTSVSLTQEHGHALALVIMETPPPNS